MRLFGSSSTPNRDYSRATTKEQRNQDQVSVLYELGLLSSSGKGARRRVKDKDREAPGGRAHLAELHPDHGTYAINFISTCPCSYVHAGVKFHSIPEG
jgi:hypothetical protein